MSPAGATVDTAKPVFVAGHNGLVGSSIVRALVARGHTNILLAGRQELDLRNQSAVNEWFAEHQPAYVYLVAGTVGGILANNSRPAEFIYDNIQIHANVINAAHATNVEKLLYLGSSCIYPRDARQPITEDQLLTGPLEPTNEWYAIAKIAGIKMCQAYRRQYGCNFISAMPTNLYGPNDNFSLESGHVLPMLMRKFHEAKSSADGRVEIWGTGSPLREFLHVDDLADACVYLFEHYEGDSHINIGSGEEVSIKQLAELIKSVVFPEAILWFDSTKPDGTPRKLLDVTRLKSLGWSPKMTLEQGVRQTYDWFVSRIASGASPRGLESTQG